MDVHFQQIRAINTLTSETVEQLANSGFTSVPGPFFDSNLRHLAQTYDQVMALGAGPDFKVGSTTTRMSDLLSHSSVFDEILLYPPLLEACAQVIGEPFKLSAFLGRTLRGETPAQELHTDLPRDSEDAPIFAFILMVDPFHKENGATRFVPGSHAWPDFPADQRSGARKKYPGEFLSCGDAGTMILFNGAIWHGHAANITAKSRRSIQGYFVRRNARSAFDFSDRLPLTARARLGHLARYLLSVDELVPGSP